MSKWLSQPEVRKLFLRMCNTLAGSIQEGHRHTDPAIGRLTQDGQFVPEIQKAILMRMRPADVASRQFLGELLEDARQALGTLYGPGWHVGSDGSDLRLQVTAALDNSSPTPCREPAEILRLDDGLDAMPRNWLEEGDVRLWFMDMCGTIADSMQHDRNGADPRTYTLTKDGAFTSAMQKSILFRIYPRSITEAQFLDGLACDVRQALGTLGGRGWHIGSDGRELQIHVTSPLDNRPPRPYRQRAKVVRMRFGHRDESRAAEAPTSTTTPTQPSPSITTAATPNPSAGEASPATQTQPKTT